MKIDFEKKFKHKKESIISHQVSSKEAPSPHSRINLNIYEGLQLHRDLGGGREQAPEQSK